MLFDPSLIYNPDTMSDDQFNTLFRYMTQHFARIEKELENKADKSQLNQILNTLDGIIARLDQDTPKELPSRIK